MRVDHTNKGQSPAGTHGVRDWKQVWKGDLGCTELGRGRGRTGKAAAFLSICMHQIWGPDKMGSVAAPINMFKSQDRVWDMAG